MKAHLTTHELESDAAAADTSLGESLRNLLGELIHEPLCIRVALEADGIVALGAQGPGGIRVGLEHVWPAFGAEYKAVEAYVNKNPSSKF